MIDGVIKYSLEYTQSESIEWKLCDEIEQIRKDLHNLGLIGVYDNGIGYGNISQIINNDKHFVITGTQTGHLKNLEAKDYSLITSVNLDTFKTIATGYTKPSSEAITHYTLYDIDKNIKAVIHIHSEVLWRFMLQNDYLATSDVEYGSIAMVKDVQAMYAEIDPLSKPLFVMKGHFEGIVTFGNKLEDAKSVLYRLINDYLKNNK